MQSKLWMALALAALPLAMMAPVSAREEPIVPDMANGDFGAYPAAYEQLIKAWAETSLKDPESARYVHITKPRKEWVVAKLKPAYGWSVCATINAKNSYGGFTGAQVWWFFFQNGQIVRSQNTSESKNVMGLIIPGNRISIGHDVSCDEGEDVAAPVN